MTTFQLATVHLAETVTVFLPVGRPRVAVPSQQVKAGSGQATSLDSLECAFWINVVTQTIHAQIARFPTPLLIYGPVDFADACSDLPDQHGERVLQVLGSDPASVLQALIDGGELPAMPPRVPREIQNWRAKAVLAQMGLLETVNTVIEAMPEPERTIVSLAWAGDAKLARRGKTVTALAAVLGLGEAQVDALFIAAQAIDV